MTTPKIFVLGGSGMLGSMVRRHLARAGLKVVASQRKRPDLPYYVRVEESYTESNALDALPDGLEFVINCIGVTRMDRSMPSDSTGGFYVNAVFPGILQQYCSRRSVRLIHISTDAVFHSTGPCYEDQHRNGRGAYALSKILGENDAPGVLNIRCSLIGHEPGTRRNLLEWFLSQEDGSTVRGYANHIWNGVTTLQLAEFICELLTGGRFDELVSRTRFIHYSPNLPLSKFDLLRLFRDVYRRDIRVEPFEADEGVIRILESRYDRFYLQSGEKRRMAGEIERMKHDHDTCNEGEL